MMPVWGSLPASVSLVFKKIVPFLKGSHGRHDFPIPNRRYVKLVKWLLEDYPVSLMAELGLDFPVPHEYINPFTTLALCFWRQHLLLLPLQIRLYWHFVKITLSPQIKTMSFSSVFQNKANLRIVIFSGNMEKLPISWLKQGDKMHVAWGGQKCSLLKYSDLDLIVLLVWSMFVLQNDL